MINEHYWLQYAGEETPPKPGAMINTLRAFGYTLSTAVADIIDNSISAGAGNIWIRSHWDGGNSWMTLLDDGRGMNLEELLTAMTPGSRNPDEERPRHDLGRFGLGLKTASFSQCRRLTVASKQLGGAMAVRCWDLEFVNQTGRWCLLAHISDESHLQPLEALEQGTLILWESMDRLVGEDISTESQQGRRLFQQQFAEAENHISLTFHRFIAGRRLKVFLNDNELPPYDPFMPAVTRADSAAGSQMVGQETLLDGNIQSRCYIMPHPTALDPETRILEEKFGSWYDRQGFYIYRGERLLVYGNWLGLSSKKEHYKLARIQVDIDNNQDAEWKIDIKKSSASPPASVRTDFERWARRTQSEAAKVYQTRSVEMLQHTALRSISFQPMWKAVHTPENALEYQINRQHGLLKHMLQQESISAQDLRRLLNCLEETIPLELIIRNHSERPEDHELREWSETPDSGTIELARRMHEALTASGLTPQQAMEHIFNIEPFNRYKQLSAYLENETI